MIFARGEWPDGIDTSLILASLLLVLGAPALGYWLMVADIRAYLRSLRGALTVVSQRLAHLPAWARSETPSCLRSLGLQLPCSVEDVKRAYRKHAEAMHPDRGGDRQRFLALQRHFEEAMRFVAEGE